MKYFGVILEKSRKFTQKITQKMFNKNCSNDYYFTQVWIPDMHIYLLTSHPEGLIYFGSRLLFNAICGDNIWKHNHNWHDLEEVPLIFPAIICNSK